MSTTEEHEYKGEHSSIGYRQLGQEDTIDNDVNKFNDKVMMGPGQGLSTYTLQINVELSTATIVKRLMK